MAVVTTKYPSQDVPVMEAETLAACYRVLAELLLNPEVRDVTVFDRERGRLASASPAIRERIAQFLASPSADDAGEYTRLLELTPPVPLYLGTYLYGEPSSCRGAGISGRNAYMIEVAAVYAHFGFALAGGELADFLPAMVEFLGLSLERRDRDGIGLRRYFVENYVRPGIAPLRAALAKYESGYGLLIDALAAAIDEDMIVTFDEPMWIPPKGVGEPRPLARRTRRSGARP